MTSKFETDGLFDRTMVYPDVKMRDRLDQLVGLDDHKRRLAALLRVLVNPSGVRSWAKRHHPKANCLIDTVLRRPPLVVLAGDVGSGKTELAETIGDAIARQEKVDVELLPLSLSSRGQGRVGEMTQLLSAAFEYAVDRATRLRAPNGDRARGAIILLVDEADALAQSREASQMHHEDRAGVNALIRGIDRIANGNLPAAVIMCTNRLTALDPAVRRRAAEILHFGRPDDAQRCEVFKRCFGGLDFSKQDLADLVSATGPQDGKGHGCTYSDLTQRLIPAIVLDAFPSGPIRPARALEIARELLPTPPFRDGDG